MCNKGWEKKRNEICNLRRKEKELWECKIENNTKEKELKKVEKLKIFKLMSKEINNAIEDEFEDFFQKWMNKT